MHKLKSFKALDSYRDHSGYWTGHTKHFQHGRSRHTDQSEDSLFLPGETIPCNAICCSWGHEKIQRRSSLQVLLWHGTCSRRTASGRWIVKGPTAKYTLSFVVGRHSRTRFSSALFRGTIGFPVGSHPCSQEMSTCGQRGRDSTWCKVEGWKKKSGWSGFSANNLNFQFYRLGFIKGPLLCWNIFAAHWQSR